MEEDKQFISVQRTPRGEQARMWSFLVYLTLFFLVWTLRATVFYAIDEHIQVAFVRRLYTNVLTFGVWFVPVYLYLRYIDNVRPFHYLRLSTRISLEGALWAGMIMSVFLLALLINAAILERDLGLLVRTSFVESSMVLLSILFSPFSEEVVFRGFVLTKLARRYHFWTANLASALLFTAVHWPNWLWMKGLQQSLLLPTLSVFVTGLVLGYLRKQSQSLWPCIVLHVINNYVVAIIGAV